MSYREFRPHTRLVLAVIWTAGALTLVWTVFRPISLQFHHHRQGAASPAAAKDTDLAA